jgi:hypothetical protein
MTRRGNRTANLIAPERGNQLARSHGFYSKHLSPLEDAEVAEIANAIRALAPLDADGLEPAIQLLAGQIWRRKRAYADLDRHGVTRGRADRSRAASILTDLTKLEGSILDGLRELGMTARSAAALGLELKRLERFRDWDFSRLTRAEKATFDELVAKASTYRPLSVGERGNPRRATERPAEATVAGDRVQFVEPRHASSVASGHAR